MTPSELAKVYQGRWVAIEDDGTVILNAATSVELAEALLRHPSSYDRVTVRYVWDPKDPPVASFSA